jgi:hypothetical protein
MSAKTRFISFVVVGVLLYSEFYNIQQIQIRKNEQFFQFCGLFFCVFHFSSFRNLVGRTKKYSLTTSESVFSQGVDAQKIGSDSFRIFGREIKGNKRVKKKKKAAFLDFIYN